MVELSLSRHERVRVIYGVYVATIGIQFLEATSVFDFTAFLSNLGMAWLIFTSASWSRRR